MSTEPRPSADDLRPEPGTTPSKVVVAGIALAAVTVIGYFALGMPGMDHTPSDSTTGMAGMDMTGPDGMDGHPLDVGSFAARMTEPRGILVKVDGPEDATIPGTDLSIPYDRIIDDGRLPTDLGTPILLYCQTGRMAEIAAEALTAAGYRDVAHLEGGTAAWRASGRRLVTG